MVDCETCVNYESDLCDECIHNDDIRENHYISASSKTMAKRKAAKIKEMEDRMITDEISATLPERFISIFNKIKELPSKDNFCPVTVFAGTNYLSTTDGIRVLELKCDIPEALRNKCIVRIEGEKVKLSSQTEMLKLSQHFATNKVIHDPDLKKILFDNRFPFYFSIYYHLIPEDSMSIALDPNLCNPLIEALGEITSLGYSGVLQPVVFVSESGRGLLCPINIAED